MGSSQLIINLNYYIIKYKKIGNGELNMNIEELKNIDTNYIGKNIIYFKEIDSTQEEARRLIEKNNAINGTIIIADAQTSGRGTHGRKWYTGDGKNIAFSIILFPECSINKFNNLTILIAKCILEAIKQLYNVDLEIKKPNDIIYNQKKIGGILTQATIVNELTKHIIIGIGINVNQEKFAPEIQNIASSLRKEFSNIDFKCEDILRRFCEIFETEFEKMIHYNGLC